MELKGFTVETDSKNLNYTVKVKGQGKKQSNCIKVKEYQIEYKIK